MYIDQLYALGVSWLNLYCKRWEMMRRDVAIDFQASNLFTELSATGLHRGLPYKAKKKEKINTIVFVQYFTVQSQ